MLRVTGFHENPRTNPGVPYLHVLKLAGRENIEAIVRKRRLP